MLYSRNQRFSWLHLWTRCCPKFPALLQLFALKLQKFRALEVKTVSTLEIQLTMEANKSSRFHRDRNFCWLEGIVHDRILPNQGLEALRSSVARHSLSWGTSCTQLGRGTGVQSTCVADSPTHQDSRHQLFQHLPLRFITTECFKSVTACPVLAIILSTLLNYLDLSEDAIAYPDKLDWSEEWETISL